MTATWRIPGGGSPDMGGVSADGSVLWLSGRYDGVVYALDTADGHLLAKIRSGPGRTGCACGRSPAGTPSATPASCGEAAAPTTSRRGEPSSAVAGYCRMPTPRAITRTEVIRAATDSTDMNSFARVDSGIVSVGLNAVEFVMDTYR